jgi:hypothetical protein
LEEDGLTHSLVEILANVRIGSGAPNWCRSQHFRFTPTSRRRADIVEPPVSARSCREQMQQMKCRLFAYSITSSAVAMSVAGNRFDKKSR